MKPLLLILLLLSSPGAPAKQGLPSGQSTSQPRHDNGQQQKHQPKRGQQVFEHYCIRCHTPPEGFSPRISETVAMHMRVRANLSEDDFKALVRFLNP